MRKLKLKISPQLEALIYGFLIGIVIAGGMIAYSEMTRPRPTVSPVPEGKVLIEITPTPTPEPTPIPAVPVTPTPTPTGTQTPQGMKWEGKASYYSRQGCIGCSATFTMANGQTLDDNGMTIAFNRLPLGSIVWVRNSDTGSAIRATVTDRGGFERYGKIADLTIGVRDAIGCGSTCNVEVSL